MNMENFKRMSAEKAIKLIPFEGLVGIGTGSTVRFLIELIGKNPDLYKNVKFVPTSEESANLLRESGLHVSEEISDEISIDIDGADEIDSFGNLVKGGGSALTREKIVAFNSKRFVVIADSSKVVKKLGKFMIPIEIIPFLAERTIIDIEKIGCVIHKRDGKRAHSDNGNFVVMADFGLIENPKELEIQIKMIPGVVEVGLFNRYTDMAFIADSNGVEVREYERIHDHS